MFDFNYDSTFKDFRIYVEIMLDSLKKDVRYDIVRKSMESYKLERVKENVRN